jgi:hypothetical protein
MASRRSDALAARRTRDGSPRRGGTLLPVQRWLHRASSHQGPPKQHGDAPAAKTVGFGCTGFTASRTTVDSATTTAATATYPTGVVSGTCSSSAAVAGRAYGRRAGVRSPITAHDGPVSNVATAAPIEYASAGGYAGNRATCASHKGLNVLFLVFFGFFFAYCIALWEVDSLCKRVMWIHHGYGHV